MIFILLLKSFRRGFQRLPDRYNLFLQCHHFINRAIALYLEKNLKWVQTKSAIIRVAFCCVDCRWEKQIPNSIYTFYTIIPHVLKYVEKSPQFYELFRWTVFVHILLSEWLQMIIWCDMCSIAFACALVPLLMRAARYFLSLLWRSVYWASTNA